MAISFLITALSVSVVQAADYIGSGIDFEIYTDSGLAFQSDMNKIFTIEILTGTWGGKNCRFSLHTRGGELYFEANETCQFQLSHEYDHSIRLDYEGFDLSIIEQGYSYNGTFTSGNAVLLHWSWSFEMPHEENFMLYVGLFGIGLFVASILLTAYFVKTVPFFTLGKGKILFEKLGFIMSLTGIIIGFGLIMVWLMS